MDITNYISDLNYGEVVETFYKKELQKINEREFRFEKVIQNSDKLYVKWKGYDNSFDSWIDKKISTSIYYTNYMSVLVEI